MRAIKYHSVGIVTKGNFIILGEKWYLWKNINIKTNTE